MRRKGPEELKNKQKERNVIRSRAVAVAAVLLLISAGICYLAGEFHQAIRSAEKLKAEVEELEDRVDALDYVLKEMR